MFFIIMAGVFGAGFLLNKNGKEQRVTATQNEEVPDKEIPLSYDVFNNNNLANFKFQEQAIADDLYQKSLNPTKTGVINPRLYQQNFTTDIENNLINAPQYDIHNFENQGQTSDFYSNDIHEKNKLPKDFFSRTDTKSIMANLYKPKIENFGFKNNIPFFKGNQPKQNLRENMTGSDFIQGKKEVKSFGVLEKNNPITTEYVDIQHERMGVLDNKKMNGVRLMEQIRVQSNTSGDPYAGWEGKNPSFRGHEYNVDQLRSKLNPKLDLSTDYVAVGKSIKTNPAIQGLDTKNKRSSVFDMQFDRAVPTSKNSGQTLRQIYENKNTARSSTDTNGYMGGPAHNTEQVGCATLRPLNFRSESNNRDNKNNFKGIMSKNNGHTLLTKQAPKTTLKQTTLKSYTGNTRFNVDSGYKIVNQNNKTTLRSSTEMDYTPPASAMIKEHKNYKSIQNVNALKSLTNVGYTPNAKGTSEIPNPDKFNMQNFRSIRESNGKDMYIVPSGKQKINTKVCAKVINFTNKVKEYAPNRINTFVHEQLKQNPYIQEKDFD